MPTILDATVVNQAYDTSGNGGRKLVRLSNGWIVAGVKTTDYVYFYVDKLDGNGFVPLCHFYHLGMDTNNDIAMVSYGTKIYVINGHGTSVINFHTFDATTVPNQNIYTVSPYFINLDTSQNDIGKVSLAINNTGTELHAAWASKNSTYPNSFNIRYAKGTINADGSVTWGSVEQVTTLNTTTTGMVNPSVVVKNNGKPLIVYERNQSAYMQICVFFKDSNDNWVRSSNDGGLAIGGILYNGGSYSQSSPSAIFVPSSVNGLPNGLIGNAWHGTDSASGGVNYIRFSKSTDLGANWSAPQKLVPGTNPTLTANKNGKLFITYEDNGVTKRIESTDNGDTWSAPITVGNGTNPSSLFDLTLNMSEPLTIRKGTSSVLFSGTWFVTTISVTPGYIGQKTSADKSNILSYSITTDGTMSDITEKINGVTIATRTNPTSGQEFTVSLTQEQWDAIKYGNGHTLTIEMGGDTWTYTFDKRLNANDDILSAVKGVQDLQTHLNGIKAQLGAAIRAKGGTVNDTDAWSAFVSAVNGIQLGKKWASGTGVTSSTSMTFTFADGSSSSQYPLEVTGLSFRPSIVLIYSTIDISYVTVLFPENLYTNNSNPIRILLLPYSTLTTTTATGYSFRLEGNAYVSYGAFRLPYRNSNRTVNWIAFE